VKTQALILGLGQFGMSTARALAQHGVEVMVVDQDDRLVQQASTWAAEAVAFDAADEAALARTQPAERDLCVVAIGDESRDGSIVVTALLRQMGAKRIVARANDTIHERILRLVGAHEVVNPERAFGERLAARLAHSNVVDQIPLGGNLVITELQVPDSLAGKSLREANLPAKLGVTVVAVRRKIDGAVQAVLPDANTPLSSSDVLVVATAANDATDLASKLS
jgi:trk system potassium uptake protein TrkA